MARHLLPVLGCLLLSVGVAQADTPRQQELAQKGAVVMPFNVHSTTHVFLKDAAGGTQQVIAKDGSDQGLVAAVRTHLSYEAVRFAHGDYSDPARMHGVHMPGLEYLSSVKPGQMEIVYRELPGGAEIRYTGKDAATVDAIHKWFDAQLSDHGSDATDKPPA